MCVKLASISRRDSKWEFLLLIATPLDFNTFKPLPWFVSALHAVYSNWIFPIALVYYSNVRWLKD